MTRHGDKFPSGLPYRLLNSKRAHFRYGAIHDGREFVKAKNVTFFKHGTGEVAAHLFTV